MRYAISLNVNLAKYREGVFSYYAGKSCSEDFRERSDDYVCTYIHSVYDL